MQHLMYFEEIYCFGKSIKPYYINTPHLNKEKSETGNQKNLDYYSIDSNNLYVRLELLHLVHNVTSYLLSQYTRP